MTVFLHIYDERGRHVLGLEREFRQHAGNEEPKLTAGPFEKDPAVLNGV